MALILENYEQLRPWLYHVTSRRNLEALLRSRRLLSAERALNAGGRTDLHSSPRPGFLSVSVNGDTIILRDQLRLRPDQMKLAEGVSLADFVGYLNRWVYFWPGTHHGPIAGGERIAEANEDEPLAIIRAPFHVWRRFNAASSPRFASCNSGAPRYSGGRPAYRDLKVHRPAGAYTGTPSSVVEVAFADEVDLPPSTEYSLSRRGPWTMATVTPQV